eukprot:534540-Prorocentrum_minimum.AAC.1
MGSVDLEQLENLEPGELQLLQLALSGNQIPPTGASSDGTGPFTPAGMAGAADAPWDELKAMLLSIVSGGGAGDLDRDVTARDGPEEAAAASAIDEDLPEAAETELELGGGLETEEEVRETEGEREAIEAAVRVLAAEALHAGGAVFFASANARCGQVRSPTLNLKS